MPLTPLEQRAREKICLPLDGLKTLDEVKARVEELSPVVGLFKVGKESYTRFGPAVVELVQRHRADVFLDLKYHDIPDTVNRAAAAAAELGVSLFTVHALGGVDMLLYTVEGAHRGAPIYGRGAPKVLGVTVLTSIDEEALHEELCIPHQLDAYVFHLAALCANAGLDGIVCSAIDLSSITPHLPRSFMYVTPGIEGPDAKAGVDQKRIATPGNAIAWGSSILVVGRAITAAPTPEERVRAGYAILQEIAQHL